MSTHYWSYCDLCEAEIVICGKCGNNCCNGGYGEIPGPVSGQMIPCTGCESAYAMQANGRRADAQTKGPT